MTSIKNSAKELRLRVFAGPNGSDQSTVVEEVRRYKAGGYPIDFGYYINADDITTTLRKKVFSFTAFDLKITPKDFKKVVISSGLINTDFLEKEFDESYFLRKNKISLKNQKADERLGQIIADFLRKKLLAARKRFSFETVFSHHSKVDIMDQARSAGYKVYLYFVSTESPLINIYRVKLRKLKGGHDVPPETIRRRYYKSLDLMYSASQIAYQAFFFDNSMDNAPFKMFAHFKKSGKKKKWDRIKGKDVPSWFLTYYINKVV